MPSVNLDDAIEAAEEFANKGRGRPDDPSGPLRGLRENIKTLRRGWYVCVQPEEFHRTRERRFMVIGDPWILVSHDGEVRRAPVGMPTDKFLAEWS